MSMPFAERRSLVKDELKDAVLLMFAAPVSLRNNDVEYEYRQDSDFFYLTGLQEPMCAMVLAPGAEHEFSLFVRPRDPERETWDGHRVGVEGALQLYGADAAYPWDSFASRLPDLIENRGRLFYAIGRDSENDRLVLQAIAGLRAAARRGKRAPHSIVEPGLLLHERRSRKSAEDVAALCRAVEITGAAHRAAMAGVRPDMGEHEIEGLLRFEFRRRGARRCAYPPIVASGPNGTILHHKSDERVMRAGELVLVDAAAEFEYYAADITRTFPVSGRFTEEQRELYSVVLSAQQAAIGAVRPGSTLAAVHNAAVEVIARGLVELGLLPGPVEDVVEQQSYKPYYMHQTSHWLGMDVHDVGPYSQNGAPVLLCEGHVLTVEPGLYFKSEDVTVPERFRGTGIRIEDDVLVTEQGNKVLSSDIPKQIDEIEALCGSG